MGAQKFNYAPNSHKLGIFCSKFLTFGSTFLDKNIFRQVKMHVEATVSAWTPV